MDASHFFVLSVQELNGDAVAEVTSGVGSLRW